MHSREDFIQANLEKLRGELCGATNLVAVSKTYPSSDVKAAYDAGQRDFGENKIQDLLEKSEALRGPCPQIRWHFIGKLQSNKINMLLRSPGLVSIHSIDSIKLLNKLLSKSLDKSIDEKVGLFLQYNTSGEEQKGGFDTYAELKEAARAIQGHSGFRLQGLMTIGSIRSDDFESAARSCFRQLAALKDSLEKELGVGKLELSMGMSQDFKIALEEGSDWVRVGSAIFGARG